MSDKKWKREISAGGVVYKKENGKIFVLLVNPRSRDFGPPEDYWTWPKGKQDKAGESLSEVALREVREEGGVNAEIEAELGYVKYFRNWQGDSAIKFVHHFLMRYVGGEPSDHDQEIAESAWFDLNEAKKKLKFDTDKEIFERAKQALNVGDARYVLR